MVFLPEGCAASPGGDLRLALLSAGSFFTSRLFPEEKPEQSPYDHYVMVNGINYHYLEYPGEKEAVFLLHGFGSSTYTWEAIIPRLQQTGYHLYALDMKGFGWSDKPRGAAYDPFTLMEEVNDWLDHMGLQKVVFVGNSLGGAIAVLMALQHPDKVGRMVLVDAGGYPMKKPLIVRLAGVPLAPTLIKMIYGPWVVRWNLKEVFYDPDKLTREQLNAYYSRLRTDGALEAQTALARSLDFDKFMPYIARISTLETETLILWGRDDAWIPLRLAEQFQSDLKNSRLHVIPGCGHIPQEECPVETAQILLDFLEGR